ncbi:MAG TPA: hypothetical protein VHY08_21440, partial [Bacillota bacterium]|nr:hypothetical protein [Bacillota bacterium]
MGKDKKPDIGITTNIRNTNIRNESTTVNHKEIYDYVFNVDNRQMIQLNNYVINITNSLQQMAAKGQEAAKKLNMEEANKKLGESFKQVSANIKLISDSVKGFGNVADIFSGMGKEGKKTTELFDKFKLALNDTITQALQPLIRIFNEGMAPILAIIANGFQKLGTSLGPLITIIGQLLQAGLQAIVPILQGLGNILVFVVQWVVNLLAPLGGLANGIKNLVPAMTILVAVIAGIKIASLIGMIPQLVAAFFAWAGSAGAAAGATIAAAAPIIAIGVAIAAGIAIVIALIQSWKELWNAAQVIWKAITDIVVAPFKLLMDLGKACYKILVGLFTLDPKMLTQGVDEIGGAFHKFTGTLVNAGKETMNALGNAGGAIWNNMVNNAKNAASIFQGTLTDSKRVNQQLTEEEKKRLAERKEFEKEWTKKLREETATRSQLLEDERQEALAKAKKLRAKTEEINAYYDKKSMDLAREQNEAKAKFEEQFTDKVEDNINERLAKLDEEKQKNIAEAIKLGADVTKIDQYYKNQREKMLQEENDKKAALEKKYSGIVEKEADIRMKTLEEERKKSLAEAKKLGIDEAKVNKYYDDQKTKLIKDGEKERRNEMLKTIQQAL